MKIWVKKDLLTNLDSLVVKPIQLFIRILCFIYLLWSVVNCSESTVPEQELEGVFYEEKGNSEYEKLKKENLFIFYKKEKEIFGKQVGLDFPLEGHRIRSCGYCSDTYEMILGYNLIKNLVKEKKNSYKGKMYDIYNRKWFDVKINYLDEKTINLRIYAFFPIFGKNIRWKKAQETYESLIESQSVSLSPENTKDLYAIYLGEIFSGQKEPVLNLRNINIENKKLYLYSRDGLNLGEFSQSGLGRNDIEGTIVMFLKK